MNEKKNQVENRWLLFAERYGYQPLPDVTNHELCKEFRDAIQDVVNLEIGEAIATLKNNRKTRLDYFKKTPIGISWKVVSKITQTQILRKKSNEIIEDARIVQKLIGDLIVDGHFSHVLSFCELVLRSPNETVFDRISNVFDRGLAPYALDKSANPICIIPIEAPESAEATIEALEQVHQSGFTIAHQHLRDAAGNINAGQFSDGLAKSVHAVEAIARDLTGENTLGPALAALEKQNLLNSQPLKEGINKLYGYASGTVRHGQPQTKAASSNISRDEALLAFSICSAIAGYLSRKKIAMGDGK